MILLPQSNTSPWFAILVSGHEPFDRDFIVERQRFECNGFPKAFAECVKSNDLFRFLNKRYDDFLQYRKTHAKHDMQ